MLYEHAKTDKVLKAEPKSSNVSFEGDTVFRKDENSGKWETGWIKLTESEDYEGEYSLSLPTGMTLEKNDKNTETTVWNGEEFRLISDEKPSEDLAITASAKVQWLQEMNQYRPAQEVTVNGKKFQRMIGAMVETASLQASLTYSEKKKRRSRQRTRRIRPVRPIRAIRAIRVLRRIRAIPRIKTIRKTHRIRPTPKTRAARKRRKPQLQREPPKPPLKPETISIRCCTAGWSCWQLPA